MKNEKLSVDGLVPRRSRSQVGGLHEVKKLQVNKATPNVTRRELHANSNDSSERVGVFRPSKSLSMNDLQASLNEIDDESLQNGGPSKPSKKDRKKNKKPKSKARRIVKWVLIFLLLIALGVGGYIAFKGLRAGDSAFTGNIFDIVKNDPLKQDANGRSNFLIFGTEAPGHPGADLTDSIMVLSVDQNKKDAYMISLPRDLWVAFDERCSLGDQSKLNALYYCASDDGANEEAGAKALAKKAGEITGLDIQYTLHLNWAALIQSVDAVGGIDLTINSSDPRGILDRNFDWVCNYKCFYVNYKNGQTVHLDGQHALALARARNASGGYGLPAGNFDREKNQQLIIKALKDKATTAGTLTNLGSVTGLIDALGDNLRTNIEKKEVRTLMDVAVKIDTSKIISLSLNEDGNMLVQNANYSGQSIVRPVAGLLDYSQISAYISKQLTSDPVVREGADITVLNGSGVVGAGQTVADTLKAKKFTIDEVANAPAGTYDAIEIYQIGTGNTATAAKLKELYNVTIKTTAPPVSVTGSTDFVIVVGKVPAAAQ